MCDIHECTKFRYIDYKNKRWCYYNFRFYNLDVGKFVGLTCLLFFILLSTVMLFYYIINVNKKCCILHNFLNCSMILLFTFNCKRAYYIYFLTTKYIFLLWINVYL